MRCIQYIDDLNEFKQLINTELIKVCSNKTNNGLTIDSLTGTDMNN